MEVSQRKTPYDRIVHIPEIPRSRRAIEAKLALINAELIVYEEALSVIRDRAGSGDQEAQTQLVEQEAAYQGVIDRLWLEASDLIKILNKLPL